jgi:mannose-1-phosphate guanylyltransferase
LSAGTDGLEDGYRFKKGKYVSIIPVILSGGGGTRLWPMSRPENPKQFLALTCEQTMFQMTAERTRDSTTFAAPIIVTGAGHADIVDKQLAAMGMSDAIIILEPCARNTAPAIALAALAASDPQAALLVMPSDHVINDVAAFHAATASVLPLVQEGWLATYGITPTGPETGYGYIQMGDALAPAVHRVARFVEKPDAERAAAMIAGGDYLWNGGIFLFRADMFLGALAVHAPDMLAAAQKAMAAARHEGNRILPGADAFAACPSDSIDYAVMEKADRVAVVPADMGWSDVGSWDALYDIGADIPKDNVMGIDSHNNLIRSDGIRIHAVGVKDMIIVASGNDVLIVPRGRSQDVKKIVEALKAQNDQ